MKLRSFLGLFNYSERIVPSLASPLHLESVPAEGCDPGFDEEVP